ncbi:hypothetical protein [Formosa sp. S-31]|uniref:hypothetical protein n=1 Tax=Formosa sp. S-31 TaxID=2790949 RepID=UPI003EBD4363
MRKLSLFLSLSLFSILSCDDGDLITVEFDFDDTFAACGELVFYNIKSDPYESLSLKISSPSITLDTLYNVGADNTKTITVNINETSNPFNYRSYNADPSDFFCNDVPPSGITITNDLQSSGGVATISSLLIEDDNDGIPAEVEDENLDGDNDPSTNPTDRDGDGIPDYLDDDDDGDNVKTSSESPNYVVGVGFVDSLDTDGDGIPDYLDPDDDGDGVLTRDEENKSQDQNPTNDITYSSVGADYLNPDVATTVKATAYREHTIEQSYEVDVQLTNIQLPGVSQDVFELGTLEDSSSSKKRYVTPEFP